MMAAFFGFLPELPPLSSRVDPKQIGHLTAARGTVKKSDSVTLEPGGPERATTCSTIVPDRGVTVRRAMMSPPGKLRPSGSLTTDLPA
jgi:hypothetical protein